MKNTLTALALIALASALQAAVPLAWKVETTRANPAQFDAYRGETLSLEATMLSRGVALDVSGTSPQLFWQTNGMGTVYWSVPASATSNVLSAVWAPTNDVGAAYYNCFIGSASGSYRAAFRLRMIAAPGYTPSVLDLPVETLDFSTVTVENPPYYTQSEVDGLLSSTATSSTNYTDAATNGLARASDIDFSTNNTTLVETIEDVAPTPGNYAAVSNAAMTAGSRIDEIEASTTLIYNLYSSSNALFEVTNYDSQVHIPSARLLSLSGNGTYSVVWDEKTNLWANAVAATNYTDAAILAATNRYALRGWSSTTSGLGVDAPPETTWISTPTTVIAGGYEFAKVVTTSGGLYFLTSNGMTQLGADGTNYFCIAAADGTSLLKLAKTDSYLAPANAEGITRDGDTVTVSVPIVSTDRPYMRYSETYGPTASWYYEENELPSDVSCAWSGSSGAWVCTVTTTASSGFFYFEVMKEGSTLITLGGALDVTNGVMYNGVKYNATPNGNKLEFIAE